MSSFLITTMGRGSSFQTKSLALVVTAANRDPNTWIRCGGAGREKAGMARDPDLSRRWQVASLQVKRRCCSVDSTELTGEGSIRSHTTLEFGSEVLLAVTLCKAP